MYPRDSEPHTAFIGYHSTLLEAASFEVHPTVSAEETESDVAGSDLARS
jgi:hypothetical protein